MSVSLVRIAALSAPYVHPLRRVAVRVLAAARPWVTRTLAAVGLVRRADTARAIVTRATTEGG